MGRGAMPTTDAEFRAQMDADSLIQAQAVKSDPKRYNAAIKQANIMKSDIMDRAKAVNSVARLKTKAIARSKAKRK